MRNFLIFDGQESRDYGVYISGSGTYNAPEREYDPLPVPGRVGDILGQEKRLANMELIYPAFIYANFKQNLAAFRSMLLSRTGYRRLSDTYHPEEYRRAYYRGGAEVSARATNSAGEFEVAFSCDPRRFLTAGEVTREFTTAGKLNNPTPFASKPLIRVYGTGTLTIGGDVITVTGSYPYIDINSEEMDCYYGSLNANSLVSFSSRKFPELQEGPTGVSFSGSITKVEITPYWWRV